MVGDERTGRGTTGDGLQDGGFHLQAAGFVEALAHGVHNLGALEEHILHLGVHHQVYIALTVAELRVFEAVVHGAVGIRFHDGKYAQGLAQNGKFLGVNGELARLSEEGEALDTHEVSNVQELLEHGVVQGFIFAGANFVPLYIYLNAAGVVLQLHEGGCAHDAAAHDAAGDAHILEVAFFGFEAFCNFYGGGIDGIHRGRVRIDAQLTKFIQRLSSSELLLVKFCVCHK